MKPVLSLPRTHALATLPVVSRDSEVQHGPPPSCSPLLRFLQPTYPLLTPVEHLRRAPWDLLCGPRGRTVWMDRWKTLALSFQEQFQTLSGGSELGGCDVRLGRMPSPPRTSFEAWAGRSFKLSRLSCLPCHTRSITSLPVALHTEARAGEVPRTPCGPAHDAGCRFYQDGISVGAFGCPEGAEKARLIWEIIGNVSVHEGNACLL